MLMSEEKEYLINILKDCVSVKHDGKFYYITSPKIIRNKKLSRITSNKLKFDYNIYEHEIVMYNYINMKLFLLQVKYNYIFKEFNVDYIRKRYLITEVLDELNLEY